MSKAKTRISFNDVGKNNHKTLDVDVEVWAKSDRKSIRVVDNGKR